MTAGSSFEFIGYWMLQHKQNGCTVYMASIDESVSDFFDILIGCLDISI